jgi:hypothetical protein
MRSSEVYIAFYDFYVLTSLVLVGSQSASSVPILQHMAKTIAAPSLSGSGKKSRFMYECDDGYTIDDHGRLAQLV